MQLPGGVTSEEMQRLAEELGGGWRLEQGMMPMVALTFVEARALVGRIEQRLQNEQVRQLRTTGLCPTCGRKHD